MLFSLNKKNCLKYDSVPLCPGSPGFPMEPGNPGGPVIPMIPISPFGPEKTHPNMNQLKVNKYVPDMPYNAK